MEKRRPADPALELVERYAREVERWLPQRQREAVGHDLRRLLSDALAKRAETGMPAEAAAVAVLSEMGRPAEVAQGYAGRSPLLSPGLTAVFLRLSGTLVGLLALLGSISLGWSAWGRQDAGASLLGALPQLAVGLASAAVEIVGLLVLIFLAVEWIGRPGRSTRPFDPRSLPPLDPPSDDRPNRGRLAAQMALVSLLIAWLHLFPDRVAVMASLQGGTWTMLPIVGKGFFRALPWLTGWWLVLLLARGALLARGRWTPGLRLADLAASLAGLVALAALFLSDPLIAASPGELRAAGVEPAAVTRLVGDLLPLLDSLAHVGVLVAWAGLAVGLARRLVALVRAS